jgi:phosphoribosylformylglycinamidine synthase
MKVETHNHPTAISPFPAPRPDPVARFGTKAPPGTGGKPKAGITGFSVSNLHLPDPETLGRRTFAQSARMASRWRSCSTGPIGGASFNNEFGRPNIGGYFR